SGHLVLKTAKYQYPDSKIFVFARNPREREFAKELGAFWTGGTEETPPEKLDAVIDTTPVWKPVVEALKHLDAGGRLVINAIRKKNVDINYLKNMYYPEHLWLEKEIKSVANVERQDVSEFLKIASNIPIKPEYEEYLLEDANKALMEIKTSKIHGAKVLKIG
ncbi:MAG: alcohol dehydrogenase, partial [Bacteroidota bacterium]